MSGEQEPVGFIEQMMQKALARDDHLAALGFSRPIQIARHGDWYVMCLTCAAMVPVTVPFEAVAGWGGSDTPPERHRSSCAAR